jgi:NitT/TauT family transport system permease protein
MSAKRAIFKHRVWIGLVVAFILLTVIRVPFNVVRSPAPVTPGGLRDLPTDLLYSWLRMVAAYVASIVFAIFVGTLAATSERRARLLLPLIDILQSIPILGFFPTAIYWFVRAGGQVAGVEMAAIFLIFTSQSWNLVFGVYDGIRSIPSETREAARSLGLGDLGIFRKLYLPACFPRIVDNSVLSWSNGWYFLMACEIMALGPMSYQVPGIGSFLAGAIDQARWDHVAVGLVGLICVIFAMDILLWRPLRVLARQFTFESTKFEEARVTTGERLLIFYRRSRAFAPVRRVGEWLVQGWVAIEQSLQPIGQRGIQSTAAWKVSSSSSLALFFGGIIGLLIMALVTLAKSVIPPWTISPPTIVASVLVSGVRILVAYIISLAWILPLVYWVHRKPPRMRLLQSSSQVLASVPATAFFPLITYFSLRVFGQKEVAVQLLLLTGMQWYLLFNVLGGASALPNDIREVAGSFNVRGWLYVRKVFLPAVFPALITGSITAVGGGWNALVVAEYFKQGHETYRVFGIGSIINLATYENADEKLLALSLLVLVTVIVLMNRFFWQPLYKWSEKKFRMEV